LPNVAAGIVLPTEKWQSFAASRRVVVELKIIASTEVD